MFPCSMQQEKIVMNIHEAVNEGSFSKDLDLSSLPAGNYIIRCKMNDKIMVDNITKQ
jgi:hypothetical protein